MLSDDILFRFATDRDYHDMALCDVIDFFPDELPCEAEPAWLQAERESVAKFAKASAGAYVSIP